ncbi:MAG: hypothetical protein HN478_19425 [Rhodospirillaceae bacterium]|jgi:hypothetical protein|nr:hypothetical protein [Rhodospirillaceae bacterium]MBT4486280.1 hypothetical protein [Rhodospirillaceae bacterium]MBT5193289.1 hypothetical protein [Rhodospirillaceae bacterium]MBT5895792.1 hypothetical protein [Rhodospirillaceae bacterium]MBT6428539.1 hypothetical protein [Rhodospirillaceae bacterium]
MSYIRNHWQGKHSLLWALWVNLVLVRALILLSDQLTLPPYVSERSDALAATVVYCLICHGIVFPWQIVGLLRTIRRHEGGVHADIWVWVAHIAIIGSLIFTLLSVIFSFQSLTPDKFVVENPLALEEARARQYSLKIGPDGRQVFVSGTLALGMTDKLSLLLEHNPKVTDIVLSSEGGHVYEGRGAAHLIRTHGLDTYVYGTCNSACATAFIGGKRRHMGRAAKLGFHQYGLELRFPIPLYDLKGEQEKEIEFYRQQGIAEPFLNEVFDASHEEIWYPTQKELLGAGIVHKIIDE